MKHRNSLAVAVSLNLALLGAGVATGSEDTRQRAEPAGQPEPVAAVAGVERLPTVLEVCAADGPCAERESDCRLATGQLPPPPGPVPFLLSCPPSSAAPTCEDGVCRIEPGPPESVRGDDRLQLIKRDPKLVPTSARQEDVLPRPLDMSVPGALPSGEFALGCGECEEVCCLECRGPTWVFGTEITFLAPNVKDAYAQYVVQDLAPSTAYEFAGDDIDSSLLFAPRVWLGIQGACWGVRGRYWHMGDGTSGADPFQVPAVGTDTGFMTHSQIDAYAIDLEGTRVFCCHQSKLTAAVGARYAYFEHDNCVAGFATVDDDVLTGIARTARDSYGSGVTFALDGRRPLFCNSCAHLFFNLRGSVLWGMSRTGAETMSSVADADGGAGSFNGALVSVSDQTYIGEVQLGVEWNYPLQCLPATALFRVAAEYQYWEAGRGYAYATSFAEEVGVVGGVAEADGGGLRMDLFGFALGAGFTW